VEFVSNVYTVDHTKVIQCNIRDITDRKHLELQAQSIIQTAMDGFWITDPQGRFLNVNDAYCKMTGYRRRELLKMNIQDVDAGENKEDTAAHIRKLIETAVPLNPPPAASAARQLQKNGRVAAKYQQRHSTKGGGAGL